MWRSWKQGGPQSKWTGIIPRRWSRGGLKAVTYALRLTWNSSGQFHFKGLSSSEGGPNIWSPPLCSLQPLWLLSIWSCPPPTPPNSHSLSTLFCMSPLSSPVSPLHSTPPPSLLLFFGLEWTRGMKVTGTWMRGEKQDLVETQYQAGLCRISVLNSEQ